MVHKYHYVKKDEVKENPAHGETAKETFQQSKKMLDPLFFWGRNFQAPEIHPQKRRRFTFPKICWEDNFPCGLEGFFGTFLVAWRHKKTSSKTSSLPNFRFFFPQPGTRNHIPRFSNFDFAISTIRTPNSMDILGSGSLLEWGRVVTRRKTSHVVPNCSSLLFEPWTLHCCEPKIAYCHARLHGCTKRILVLDIHVN